MSSKTATAQTIASRARGVGLGADSPRARNQRPAPTSRRASERGMLTPVSVSLTNSPTHSTVRG